LERLLHQEVLTPQRLALLLVLAWKAKLWWRHVMIC
jgi:hypothetical protein